MDLIDIIPFDTPSDPLSNLGGPTGPYLSPKQSQFCFGKVLFDGSPYQTLNFILMLVVIVGRMMMSRVTVVGVVEGDVCAHEQPICQTPHVITTTVTHSASTKQTFSSLVKKKYNTETHSASTEQTFFTLFYQ